MIMRALFEKVFSMSFFNTGIMITPFSPAHIVYLVLIFGGTFATWYFFRNKETAAKTRVLRALAYMLVFSYLLDFLFHDFIYGGLNINKLPFHVCTVLCPLVAVAQFNKNGHKIAEPIAILSMLGPLMYLCYPASVGSGEPWCYQAVQTMFYHGVQLAWGVLSVALGAIKPDIRRWYQSGILLAGITLWATFGNALIPGNNWFYLQEDAFYIGLVEKGVIPQWSLMIINPVVFLAAIVAIYGIIYAVRAIFSKKKETVTA